MRPEASAHSGTTERESCSSAESSTSGHGYPATKIPEEPYFRTRSYLSMPPTAKPNRGDWLLRSKTTRPAFSRCRPAATVRRAALSLRIWSGTASLPLAAAARKPDSGKVCIARGTSISQFSNADRRVSGRLRTTGSLERHQLGRAGSATLTPKNNRESYSRSKRKQDSR